MHNNPQILVVDDDPALRHATVRLLKRADYQVFEAATGDEALRQRVAELDDALAWSRQEPQRNGNQLANGQAAENFGRYIGLSSTDFNFNGFSLGDMTEV